MSITLISIDILGLALAIIGFLMTFRPAAFRRMTGMPPSVDKLEDTAGDPLSYALRIAGMMTMMFGLLLAGMFTLVYAV